MATLDRYALCNENLILVSSQETKARSQNLNNSRCSLVLCRSLLALLLASISRRFLVRGGRGTFAERFEISEAPPAILVIRSPFGWSPFNLTHCYSVCSWTN
jgi:hypothetical protein